MRSVRSKVRTDMPSGSIQSDLRPDEFALYFAGEGEVGAAELGTFLQQVASVASRAGADSRLSQRALAASQSLSKHFGGPLLSGR